MNSIQRVDFTICHRLMEDVPTDQVELFAREKLLKHTDNILKDAESLLERRGSSSPESVFDSGVSNERGFKNATIDNLHIKEISLSIEASNWEEFEAAFIAQFRSEINDAIEYIVALKKSRLEPVSSRESSFANRASGENRAHAVSAERLLKDIFNTSARASLNDNLFQELVALNKNSTFSATYNFADALRRVLQNPESRRRVAEAFTQHQQEWIIKQLDSVHAGYMLIFIKAAGLLAGTTNTHGKRIQDETIAELVQETGKSDRDILSATNLSRSVAVDFTLTYLVCERGSQFNRKMYMRSLVRQLAQRHNLGTEKLSRWMYALVAQSDVANPIKSDLLEILAVSSVLPGKYEVGSKGSDAANQQPSSSEPASLLGLQADSGVSRLDVQRALKKLRAWFVGLGNVHSDQNLVQRDALIAQFRYVLEHAPDKLIAMIKQVAEKQGIERLQQALKAVPKSLLSELCASLSNSVPGEIRYLLPAMVKLHDQLLPGKSFCFNEFFVEWFLCDSMLARQDSTSVLSRMGKHYFDYLTKARSSGRSDKLNSLSDLLVKLAEDARRNQPAYWDLASLLNRHIADLEYSGKSGAASDGKDYPLSDADKQLFGLFVDSIQQGEWQLTEDDWARLKAEHTRYLFSMTRVLLQSAIYRKQFIHRIPVTVQLNLLSVLEPENAEFLQKIWSSSGQIHQLTLLAGAKNTDSLPKLTSSVSSQSEKVFSLLRELTFNFIVDQRGSVFNRRGYARYFLRSLCRHFNLNYVVALQCISHLCDQAGLPQPLVDEWRLIAGDGLALESQKHSIEPGAGSAMQHLAEKQMSEQHLREKYLTEKRSPLGEAEYGHLAAKAVETLQQIIGPGTPPKVADLHKALRFIAAGHYIYFKRFSDYCRSHPHILSMICDRIDHDSLVLLVRCFIGAAGLERARTSTLMAAIQSYAERCSNQQFFYTVLIEDILAQVNLDLESTLQRAQAKAAGNHSNKEPRALLGPIANDLEAQAARPSAENLHSSTSSEANHHVDKKSEHPWEIEHTLCKERIQSLATSLSEAGKLVWVGEATLLSWAYSYSVDKMRVLYPVLQLLHLLIEGCENASNNSLGSIKFNHLVTESRWRCIAYHYLARQLLHPGCVSVDLFVQQVFFQVFRIWQPNTRQFELERFSQYCSRLIHNPGFQIRSEILRETQQVISSLTASDLGLPKLNTEVDDRAKVEADVKSDTNAHTPSIVSYCGLVLLAPYIPVLLNRLGCAKDDLIIQSHQFKACQVLLYLATGEQVPSTVSNDRQSSVNTGLICALLGLPVREKVSFESLSSSEVTMCDELLDAVIQHWSAIGATSIAGLRETFLMRDGALLWREEKGWLLEVEERGVDVLIDRLPWNFNIIKFPFMADAIHVHWRND
ncbi:contractile injection system tape measure protein [Teredinibacter turnerae]|uniref:contractile injection system tape measure protein n=1 Tax=Teredinibacter turnerae TaxID=2426 RepID=UPI00041B414E|nr:contractile injection system tape measure protein [Teredinibacter turnerae]